MSEGRCFHLHKWNWTMITTIPADQKPSWAAGSFLHISLQYLTFAVAVLCCIQKGNSSLIYMSELAATIWAPRHWLTHGFRPLAWTNQNALQQVFRPRQRCINEFMYYTIYYSIYLSNPCMSLVPLPFLLWYKIGLKLNWDQTEKKRLHYQGSKV